MSRNIQIAEDSRGKLMQLLAKVENGRSKEPMSFVQIAENSQGKLMHLLAEVENGRSKEPMSFVQTPQGVESMTTGRQALRGDLRHRFTATYPGTKEQYIQSVHNAGYDGQHKKQMLERAGAINIRNGFGAAMSVAAIASAGLTTYQVGHLWNQFMADGIIDPQEAARMGFEILNFTNVPSMVKDTWAVTHDGVEGMDFGGRAEETNAIERAFTGQGGDAGAGEASAGLMNEVAGQGAVEAGGGFLNDVAAEGAAEAGGGFLSELIGAFFG